MPERKIRARQKGMPVRTPSGVAWSLRDRTANTYRGTVRYQVRGPRPGGGRSVAGRGQLTGSQGRRFGAPWDYGRGRASYPAYFSAFMAFLASSWYSFGSLSIDSARVVLPLSSTSIDSAFGVPPSFEPA